ncbi:MAG TPA: ABC transporter substrate-binding protein [Longimicrobiales bacterium]|nr:ABC transporter substrate-binding protein [Longimicrobiales bacterium]
MARPLALAAAIAAAVLFVSGAGGSPAQTPKRGGTLVIGTRPASEPACLNAFRCELGVTFGSFVGEVLPGAFEVLPNATFRSDLIAGADIVSRSPFTVVYRIRPEARWNDGVRVTASDFVFTDRMRRRHPRLGRGVDLHHTHVRTALAVDAKTVRVVLRAPHADWRYLFDIVLPRHALVGEDFERVWAGEIDNPKTRESIGSGPFLIGRWERGKQLTFVRSPRYWGPHPAYLQRIVFRFLPVEDIEPALRRGEIDMIDPAPAILGASANEFHRRPAPGIRALHGLCACYEHFTIRMGEGGHRALRSRLVRQAIAYGIDRAAIARETGRLSGAGTAALQPADSAVHIPSSPYYRTNWQGFRYQTGRARRLLKQAGCRPGRDGVYICAGERLSLRFVAPAGIERRELTVRLAQAQLRQVGVEVRLVFGSPQTVLGQILPSGAFDLILFGWSVGASTAGWKDVFGCQGPSNHMGYCDRLVTRDLVQATRVLDDTRRAGLLNGIDARLAKAVPMIPLYLPSSFWAFKATLRGVVPNGPGSFAWNSEDWWLDR